MSGVTSEVQRCYGSRWLRRVRGPEEKRETEVTRSLWTKPRETIKRPDLEVFRQTKKGKITFISGRVGREGLDGEIPSEVVRRKRRQNNSLWGVVICVKFFFKYNSLTFSLLFWSTSPPWGNLPKFMSDGTPLPGPQSDVESSGSSSRHERSIQSHP